MENNHNFKRGDKVTCVDDKAVNLNTFTIYIVGDVDKNYIEIGMRYYHHSRFKMYGVLE